MFVDWYFQRLVLIKTALQEYPMSKSSFPRRKPIAGFGARIFRGTRLFLDITVAAFLIAILAVPALVVTPNRAAASPTNPMPVPYSEPREPFVVHDGPRLSGFAASILNAASNAISIAIGALAPTTVPAVSVNA